MRLYCGRRCTYITNATHVSFLFILLECELKFDRWLRAQLNIFSSSHSFCLHFRSPIIQNHPYVSVHPLIFFFLFFSFYISSCFVLLIFYFNDSCLKKCFELFYGIGYYPQFTILHFSKNLYMFVNVIDIFCLKKTRHFEYYIKKRANII